MGKIDVLLKKAKILKHVILLDEEIENDGFIEALGLDFNNFKLRRGDAFIDALNCIIPSLWGEGEVI